tara:strand:- start:369 stop:1355 length:987 start_codon:yes stop_codon:yes gene_type:complete
MSKDEVFSKCRRLYKDILNGYTYVPYHKLYVKHFKEVDVGEISQIKQYIIEESKSKGLKEEKEKVEFLIENELWELEKEQTIESLTEQINNHKQAKTKLFLKAQLNAVQKQIDTKSKQLKDLQTEKDSVLGLTLEKYSDRRSSEQIIRLALFKDKELQVPLFSESEYDDLDPSESEKYIAIYSGAMSEFTNNNLKMISAASFFMNPLMLSKSNPFIFFGKSLTQLTTFQTEIFSIGLSYKSVLEKGDSPSAEYHSDLEKMVEWYESAGNIQQVSEKAKERDGSTVMGASKEELRNITKGENAIDLLKEAEKKGGNLDLEDFIRIHSGD